MPARVVAGAAQHDAGSRLGPAGNPPQPAEAAPQPAAQSAYPAVMEAFGHVILAQAGHAVAPVIGDPARDLPLLDVESLGRLRRTPAVDQHPLDDLPPLRRRDIAALCPKP